MTQNENWMIIAIEECSEVQKELSKIMRFGLNNYNPFDPLKITNEENFLEEYYQLQVVIEYMQKLELVQTLSDKEIDEIKKCKIENVIQYMNKSIELGTVKN
jgi:carboxypeptidase C (cathepsin A)